MRIFYFEKSVIDEQDDSNRTVAKLKLFKQSSEIQFGRNYDCVGTSVLKKLWSQKQPRILNFKFYNFEKANFVELYHHMLSIDWSSLLEINDIKIPVDKRSYQN